MRILICDDQNIVCEGLKLILESVPDFEVIGIATDGAQAVEMVAAAQPDLVLMDLKMPIMNGIQATDAIKQRFPAVKVLILTTYSDDEWLFDAIRSGADGYVLKDIPHEDLFKVIHGTVAGETHVDPHVAGKLFDHVARRIPPPDAQLAQTLNPREITILGLMARGYTNAEIAKTIHLSEGTVRNYMSAIFAKLDVSDRTQAALMALRYGLIDIGDIS
ncbi:MAG: response regulator transcription factor [Chloroflexales bacterium]|nr:response regulator transcription factor [Chloroflexales bacterium]